MSSVADAELLAAYRARRDAAAFELLVRRHIGFVYSSALRQVRARSGCAHLADDITQAVFILLANKATTLRSDVMLRDWLFLTTRYAARNAMRADARRKHHERIAAARRAETIAAASGSLLDELSPMLDEGIASLRAADRRGVLMSFFDNLTFREVGRALGVSEDAARKRVARAVEKLRAFFDSRGIAVDAMTLSGELRRAAASCAAPVALVSSVLSATAGNSASALALAKGTGTMMTWIQVKSVAALIAVCVASGITVSAVALSESGPDDSTTSSPSAKPQAAASVATFADGVAIELLGVAHSSDGKWYTGTGAPTDEQCDANDQMSPTSHQVCFRINKLPEGANVVWKTTADMWSAKPASKAGAEVPGMFTIACEQRRKPTLDITCKIATAEWETLASCKATGTMCHPYDQGSVAFAPMYEQDGGTCASIAHDIVNHQVRVQALDGDGVAHAAEVRVINSPGKLVQMNLFFPLPMDKIDKVELQVRPYDHVATFKGISLDVGQRSEVKVTTEGQK